MLCSVHTLVYGQGLGIEVTHGAESPVCREVVKAIGGASSSDFRWSWRKYFDNVLWNADSYSFTGRDGESRKSQYRYALVDLDNDGRQDAVLLETEFIESKDWDRLYLTTPEKLNDAIRNGTVRDLLLEAPGLNDGFNGVDFLRKQVTAIPLELQIWRRNGETLVLMLEHYVASADHSLPNALLVGRLSPKSEDVTSTFPHLRPSLVCRMAVSAPTKRRPVR
jgi:hypothetical protein